MKARFFKVKSFSTPGKEYQVVQDIYGVWHCTCPAYVFQKRNCNHIRKVRHQKLKHHKR